MDAEMKKIQEKRREQFAEMYRETFGQEPNFDSPEEDENTVTVITLNFYGVKCNWM